MSRPVQVTVRRELRSGATSRKVLAELRRRGVPGADRAWLDYGHGRGRADGSYTVPVLVAERGGPGGWTHRRLAVAIVRPAERPAMPTIELRLPEPLLADLDAAAAAGGVTRSEELRRIIARELHGRYE